MAEASEEVYSSLHRRFKGDLLRRGQGGYEDARAIWNGMVARTPALIARCADIGDDGRAAVALEHVGQHPGLPPRPVPARVQRHCRVLIEAA